MFLNIIFLWFEDKIPEMETHFYNQCLKKNAIIIACAWVQFVKLIQVICVTVTLFICVWNPPIQICIPSCHLTC